jgi:glucose/arabinose dehydrogenase
LGSAPIQRIYAGASTVWVNTPLVTLSVSPGSVVEDGAPNLVFTFTRSSTAGALSVNYGIGGTATNGTDYATITSPVSFVDGSATATVTVNPTVDATQEADETVAITVLSGTGYTVGTAGAAVGTIVDDDAPGGPALPAPTLYVPLTIDGRDVSANAFTDVSGTGFIVNADDPSPVATNTGFSGTLSTRAWAEFADTAALNPGTSNFFISAYVKSLDGFEFPAWFSKGFYQSSTGAFVAFLNRNSDAFGFGTGNPWTEVQGPVATPIEVWARITVSRTGNVLSLYRNETLLGTLDVTGRTLTNTSPLRVGRDGGTSTDGRWAGRISDAVMHIGAAITPSQLTYLVSNAYGSGTGSPSQWSIATTDLIVASEGASPALVPLQRRVSASGVATLQFVPSELAGGALAGVDYTAPGGGFGTVSFADGVATANASITLLPTAAAAPSKAFLVGIQNPSAGGLSSPRTARVLIVNNKGASRVMFASTNYQVSEDGGVVTAQLIRAGVNTSAATVTVSSTNGTAIAGADFTAVNGTVTFAPGEFSKTVSVIIANRAGNQFTRTFTLGITDISNSAAADTGYSKTTTVTILDTTSSLGTLTRSDFATGLTQPTGMDWLPNGDMLVAQKTGEIRYVSAAGTIRGTDMADLSAVVNSYGDRGCLGVAVHPNFGVSNPYIYVSYAYDPPETVGGVGNAAPDGQGNRCCRVDRCTVDLGTYTVTSRVTILGTNSVTAYIGSGLGVDSTGDIDVLPSGIVNGTTITAPASSEISTGYQDNSPGQVGTQNQNIRDFLTVDSTSHMIGGCRFGPDGNLYVPLGDGTSYNFVDPRAVRCQDIGNLSGTMMRIDPITGAGVPSNPYYSEASGTAPGTSNQSKVFYYGVRNPFRYTFDPRTGYPVMGDVGYGTWESVTSGPPGSNFGWPFLEGGAVVPGYSSLPQAVTFIANGNVNAGSPNPNPVVAPIVRFGHGAPNNFNSITMGDFMSTDVFVYSDLIDGRIFAGVLAADRSSMISSAQIDTLTFCTEFRRGPDGHLYGCQLYGAGFGPGRIVRWVAS